MMRLLSITTFVSLLFYIVVKVGKKRSAEVLPEYLQVDEISENHQTAINLSYHSIYTPDTFLQQKFITDYKNIWAHLNFLYSTNNVVKGKRYYTENWFKFLANQYPTEKAGKISRKDESHNVHVHNWAWDNLVCNLVDSNIVMHYKHPDNSTQTYKVTVAMTLLFEGDYWRIDGMKVLDQVLIR